VMLVTSTIVIRKIQQKSKNLFAYTLMIFTITLALANIGESMSEMFRSQVLLPNRVHYFDSYYAYCLFNYLYILSALQGWIFGVRYLTSAIESSLT
jgi:hypothetical protein